MSVNSGIKSGINSVDSSVNNNAEIVKKIFTLCREKQYTIATAESVTGGRIASEFTAISGSSEVFTAGVVCYSEHSKVHSAGVDIRLINEKGVYNEEVVAQMAERIAKRNVANIGIATSGSVDTGEIFFGFYIKPENNTNFLSVAENKNILKTLVITFSHDKDNVKKLTRNEIQNEATTFSLSYILDLLQKI